MGDIFCSGLGFITTVIVSKELTVKEFGVVMLSLYIVQAAATAACFGLDRSAVRFISYFNSKDKNDEAFGVLKTVIYMMFVSSMFFAAIVYGGESIFGESGFSLRIKSPIPYKVLAISVFIAAIFSIVRPSLYGYKMFKASVLVQLLVDTTKLLSVSLLVILKKLNAASFFIAYAGSHLAGIIMGSLSLQRFLAQQKINPIHLSAGRVMQLISYSKWIFIGRISDMLLSVTALSMLERLISAEASGIYGLALSLTYIFNILINSAISTYLPEVSEFNKTYQVKEFLKYSFRISIYCGLVFIPAAFLSKYAIIFIFGTSYAASTAIFNILLLSYIPASFKLAAWLCLQSINRPEISSIEKILSLLFMYVGCRYLIPTVGTIAPAYITLISTAGSVVFYSIYIPRQMSRGDSIFQNRDKRYFQ
ncbi:MAG: oligosaccharide flippase family protein [Nitrospirae bacterium]|nr:oligosaccharide flippase family protein [Nitrospirota bacterium]